MTFSIKMASSALSLLPQMNAAGIEHIAVAIKEHESMKKKVLSHCLVAFLPY